MSKSELTAKNSRLLKVSFNAGLINKEPPKSTKSFREGFDPHELLIDDVAEAINMGAALSYQFRDGVRKKDNFLCADILCVDIDGSRTIEDALEDPIVKMYGSLLYTTPSHQQYHHRFRIAFVLPRTIEEADEVVAASRSLSRRLGGDMSATDAARIFFGSKDSYPDLLGSSISSAFLDELITDGHVQPTSDSISSSSIVASRSTLKLDLNQTVRLVDGTTVPIESIDQKTTVCCPYHYDQHPSAFVAFNSRGNQFLHCTKCQLTWWGDRPPDNDFNEFQRSVIDLKIKTSTSPTPEVSPPIGLEGFMEDEREELTPIQNVTIQDSAYLEFDEVQSGITFIKSPKGSGKTTCLANIVRNYTERYSSLEEFEEDTFGEDKPLYHQDRSVLVIGHRQSLIGDLCNRLGINSYLDDHKVSQGEIRHRQQRYGVCLDSLWKVQHRSYDLLIIDEVEQVLGHFLSDTIGTKRYKLFQTFSKLIGSANKIVVLDADIGWTSFTTLTNMLARKQQTIAPESKPTPVYIHLNTWTPDRGTINLYASDKHLIAEMIQSALDGKRVFVSSNSKKKIKALEEAIATAGYTHKKALKSIAITSENSRSSEVEHFILNVKTEILKYDVILSSPSLGTGIDITFENDDRHIDCVYGLYENRVNSHLDIDQQLLRVRHPKEVNVWISPQRFHFETDIGVIAQNLADDGLQRIADSGFLVEPSVAEDAVSPFLQLAAAVTSDLRKSKNDLKVNFVRYKEEQGWQINWVENDREATRSGKLALEQAKTALTSKHLAQLLNCEPLNLYDFERVKDRLEFLNLPVSRDLLIRYRRTQLELFYCLPATEDLILTDQQKDFRSCVALYRRVHDTYRIKATKQALSLFQNKTEHRIRLQTIKDKAVGAYILRGLLLKTPIFEDNQFLGNREFSSVDLTAFAEASLSMRTFVVAQFDLKTRKDVDKKPIQHLNSLLSLVGLSLEKSKPVVTDGKKIYPYFLQEESIAAINEIIDRQKHFEKIGGRENAELSERYSSRWAFLNRQYGFTYSDEQMGWLHPGYSWNGEKLRARNVTSGVHEWALEQGLEDNSPLL